MVLLRMKYRKRLKFVNVLSNVYAVIVMLTVVKYWDTPTLAWRVALLFPGMLFVSWLNVTVFVYLKREHLNFLRKRSGLKRDKDFPNVYGEQVKGRFGQ